MVLILAAGPFGTAVAEVPTLVSPVTGRVWMDRNLGANRVAESPADERAFGAIYRWNRATAYPSNAEREWDPRIWGDESIDLKPGVLQGKEIVWRDDGWETANNPCPPGFDIPTKAEWEAEQIRDAADGFARLRLPLAMYRASEGYTQGFGWSDSEAGYEPKVAYYWSRTTYGDVFFHHFRVSGGGAAMGFVGSAYGFSLRCIQNPGALFGRQD